MATGLILSVLTILSNSSQTDKNSKGQEVGFIKKQKDALLLKILETLNTRKSVEVEVEEKKILRKCRFDSEVSR